jgi:hypothetical protein
MVRSDGLIGCHEWCRVVYHQPAGHALAPYRQGYTKLQLVDRRGLGKSTRVVGG